jgi:TPR repeat protein
MDAWELYRTPKDRREARVIVAQLVAMARGGDREAMSVLGLVYENGMRDVRGRVVVRGDRRRARAYEERGAAFGDPDAMAALANRLVGARASAASLRRAIALYRRAFAGGAAWAAYNLACTYQNRGRYRDAVRWFRRAAAAGDESALLQIAHAELYGIGTRRDVAGAVGKLRRLARSRRGYYPDSWMQVEAMMIMARVLLDGWPRPRDVAGGMRWLRRAAALGHGPAVAELRFHGGLPVGADDGMTRP